MRRAFLAVMLAALSVLASARADAHAIGLSRGEYAREGSAVRAVLTFARADVRTLAPELDADDDGTLTLAELARGQATLAPAVLARIGVEAGGAPCQGTLDGADLTEGDGLAVRATYACREGTLPATADLSALLEALPRGHRHLARTGGGETVLFEKQATLAVAPTAADATATPQRRSPGALGFVRMGVEHILSGYDHLLFLFGLLVVGGSLGALLRIVSAFTLAHSITLAVAALGFWTPSARIVEPLIALSIAYVGIENLWSKNLAKRWRLTFAFGLIHGFGFASALRDVALARAEVPVALLGFNVGVELGQLLVVALVLPMVWLARRAGLLDGVRARVPSLGIALAGAVWFVARVV